MRIWDCSLSTARWSTRGRSGRDGARPRSSTQRSHPCPLGGGPPGQQRVRRSVLRPEGIIFDNVVSSTEAIEQLLMSTYDLVITDLGRRWSSDASQEATTTFGRMPLSSLPCGRALPRVSRPTASLGVARAGGPEGDVERQRAQRHTSLCLVISGAHRSSADPRHRRTRRCRWCSCTLPSG